MVINVHAGHNPAGMIACGAVGLLNESVEDRAVKDIVISQLRSMGHTVYDCTCNNGTSQADVLNKIVAMCNSHTVDLDVSIHFNAGGGNGTEVWVYPNGGANAYASSICSAISSLGFRNRGVKTSTSLYYLNKTRATALLVECCFVDSQEDYNLYDPNSMASAIVKGITGQQTGPTPPPTPPTPTTSYDAYYSVRAYSEKSKTNTIYPEVTNTTDYAGVPGNAIKDIAVRISSGTVEYRVHVLNGGWLPWVTGCNWNDYNNGYAGNGKFIDGVQIRTKSDVQANIQYRVSTLGGNYLPWVTEDKDYAGIYGRKIDRLQITF